MASSSENWDSVRGMLLEAAVTNEGLGSADVCCVCKGSTVVARCMDCNGKRLCVKCDALLHHQEVFHHRDLFISECFEAVSPAVVMTENGDLTLTSKLLLHLYCSIPNMYLNQWHNFVH